MENKSWNTLFIHLENKNSLKIYKQTSFFFNTQAFICKQNSIKLSITGRKNPRNFSSYKFSSIQLKLYTTAFVRIIIILRWISLCVKSYFTVFIVSNSKLIIIYYEKRNYS